MCRSLSVAVLLVLALALLAPGAFAQRGLNSPYLTNRTLQYEHPENDVYNPLRYIPNLPIAALATALWAILSAGLAVLCYRYGQLWMLTAILGSLAYSFGMAVRIWFRQDTHASTVYIILYLFTTLSPCAMLATDYILLGRIVRHLGMDKHLIISASKTMTIFVCSDVATFLIQAAGGGMAATRTNLKLRDTGVKIFFAGILLQMVSFVFFTVVSLLFLWKMRKHEPQLWSAVGGASKETLRWKVLYFGMLWSCVGILIRSVFRTAELSEGFGGYLAIHEVFIYTLDTLPLFLAMITYLPIYPGRYLRPGVAGAHPLAYNNAGKLKTHLSDPDSVEEATIATLADPESRTLTPVDRTKVGEKV